MFQRLYPKNDEFTREFQWEATLCGIAEHTPSKI